jgi:hypothetical protein
MYSPKWAVNVVGINVRKRRGVIFLFRVALGSMQLYAQCVACCPMEYQHVKLHSYSDVGKFFNRYSEYGEPASFMIQYLNSKDVRSYTFISGLYHVNNVQSGLADNCNSYGLHCSPRL